MSASESTIRNLLGPALEAARKALRRLESHEVPADLAKVAAYTGGNLPPPLAKRLIQSLDAEKWLRDKALEQYGEADIESGRAPVAASSLFLTRPFGWWEALARLAGELDQAAVDADQAALRAQVATLAAAIEEAKRREKACRDEIGRITAEAKRTEKRLRKQIRPDGRPDQAVLRGIQESAADAEERAAVAEAAAIDATRIAEALMGKLRRLRRERAGLERRYHEATSSSGAAERTPLELARVLDDLATTARPVGPAGDEAPRETHAELRLPSGVRPDEPAAIDWLLGQPVAFTMVVDGYNVSFLLSEHEFASPMARQRLEQELARLVPRSQSVARAIVVYDSTMEGRREATTWRGVEVLFAPADRLADDEIVRLAHETPGPVVVVSTDREVRDRSEQAGALALWSQSLVKWLRRPS